MRGPAAPRLRYTYNGVNYTADRIVHMKFLNVPGRLRGLGPISAARQEIDAAAAAKDCKARFYRDSSNIKAYLHSTEKITQEEARQAKEAWEKPGAPGFSHASLACRASSCVIFSVECRYALMFELSR